VGRTHVLERTQLVRRPRPEVWAFFADPAKLEAITPGFLRFRLATPGPIAMVPGALIDYRLSLFGVPFGWQTRIEEVEEGARFVDVQVRGPYRHWRHVHLFEDAPGGTLVRDRVEYELPLGRIGGLARTVFVGRALERIFDHRQRQVEALLSIPS
jgi:ligand-binding SRPBCC domain-containing protein